MQYKEIITKKALKEVLEKVKSSSVYRLYPEELCAYLSVRLVTLINEEYIVNNDGILYRLCEVGPGNLRFDPLSITLFMDSKRGQDLLAANEITLKDHYFYSNIGIHHTDLFKIKDNLIESINQQIRSQKTMMFLKQKLESIFKGSGYSVIDFLLNKDKNYLEFIIKTEDQTGNILIRVHNTNEWMFPDSWQIWDIFQKANREHCVPILISSKIHGSCFPLFKALGILARTTYGPFTMQRLEDIKSAALTKIDKDSHLMEKISYIKVNPLLNNTMSQSLKGIEQLLIVGIPEYLDEFKIRFEKSAKKIMPHLLADLKPLLDDKEDTLKPAERLSRIKGILIYKVGHLNLVKDFVKRHEDLIMELKTD